MGISGNDIADTIAIDKASKNNQTPTPLLHTMHTIPY